MTKTPTILKQILNIYFQVMQSYVTPFLTIQSKQVKGLISSKYPLIRHYAALIPQISINTSLIRP
jgi:hypothetical protein